MSKSGTRTGRRRWRGGLFALLLAGGAAWAVWRLLSGPIVPVTAVVRRPLVQRVVANGRVQAPARLQLGTMAGGVVAQVTVDAGSVVEQGELLVALQDSEARAALAQAQAGVAQARGRIEQIRQVQWRTAQEELRQAEVSLRLATQQLARLAELQKQQVVPAQEVENAQANLELVRSRRESAAVRERSTAPGGSELLLAQAALEAAEATLAGARAKLEQTRLLAPCAGIVLARRVEPGDVVQPGQPLLELARQGESYLAVQPEEKSLALLAPGQQAIASADAFPDRHFPALVTEIAPAVDPLRGTVEVKLRLPEPPAFLRPEMTVSVDVEVARREAALVLPAELVRDAAEQPWVLAVRDGHAERRPVVLGLTGEGMVEIVQGLAEGERVVAAGAPLVGEGQRVRTAP